jgi:hypothetical protein
VTTPIRQTIVDAMVTLFASMTPATGYNLDWSAGGKAQKVRNVANTVDLPTVVVEDRSEDKTGETNTKIDKRMSLEVHGLIAWPKTDDEFELFAAIDDAASDIERALLLENPKDPPLGITGARRVEVNGHTKDATEDGLLATVRVTVDYQHNSTDPGVYT